MNKKGLMFYWVVIGIGVAVGLFFFMSVNDIKASAEKGTATLEFLEFYQEANNMKSHFDLKIGHLSQWWLIDFAKEGGFAEESQCGIFDGYNLWNLEDKYCFPENYKDNFYSYFQTKLSSVEDQHFFEESLFTEKWAYSRMITYDSETSRFNRKIINAEFSDLNYEKEDLKLEGSVFSGKTDEKIIFKDSKNKMKYSINSHFKVNLNVDLDSEFQPLSLGANNLLTSCKNVANLESCLNNNKANNWYYAGCDDTKTFIDSEENRKVRFCIKSSNGAQVYNFDYELQDLFYQFALDFTPDSSFVIEEKEVYQGLYGDYLIEFDYSDYVESYTVYVTDSFELDYYGSAQSFCYSCIYYQPYIFFLSDIDYLECPTDIGTSYVEVNKAYYCDDGVDKKIVYSISDSEMLSNPGIPYYVTVTSTIGGEESDIAGFKDLN